MNTLPITLCLFTSTRGHFDIKTRYLETLASLSARIPHSEFAECIAHIKVTPGEEAVAALMADNLSIRGFRVVKTEGHWSHGSESHQIGYLADSIKVYSQVKTPYVLSWEDDWTLKCEGEFVDHLVRALDLFNDCDLMQVRIPRYSNEYERIKRLPQTHRLDRGAEPAANHFRHNDFSANPSLYRTRDIRAALLLTMRTNLPKHIEHGLAEALKLFSYARYPFACLLASQVRIGHIGVKPGEEDDLTKDLLCQ